LNQKDTKIDFNFINDFNEALDVVEASEGPAVLVTIGTVGNKFSTGFDLKFWSLDYMHRFSSGPMFSKLLARLMGLPVPTLAVLNGHTFAGAVFLAIAHDYRIMCSTNKTFLSISELNIGI